MNGSAQLVRVEQYYPGLDLIRLSAALMVACFHLGYLCWLDVPQRQLPGLAPFASAGWVGVPIFFLLSGFVIAGSADGRSAGAFVRSRASRLYPAAWLCATLTFIVAPSSLGNYARSMLLLPAGPWISGVYWTLAVEIIFYAVVAASVAQGLRLTRLALGLGICSSLFWIAKAVNAVAGDPIGLASMQAFTGSRLLLHDGIFFAAGMLLRKNGCPAVVSFFLGIASLAIVWRSQALVDGTTAPLVPPLLWMTAVAAMMFCVARNPAISFALERWPTRTIGLMTYPLYLIHLEVGRAIMLFVSAPALAFMFGLGAVILLALALVPLEKLIRRTLLPRSDAPAFEVPSLP